MTHNAYQNTHEVDQERVSASWQPEYENNYDVRYQHDSGYFQAKQRGRHLSVHSRYQGRKYSQTKYWIIALASVIVLSAFVIHSVACAPLKKNIVNTWIECSGSADCPEFLFVGNHTMEYRIDTARSLESTTLMYKYYWFPISSDKIAIRMALPGCRFHVYEVEFEFDGIGMTTSPSITGNSAQNSWLLWG